MYTNILVHIIQVGLYVDVSLPEASTLQHLLYNMIMRGNGMSMMRNEMK